MKSYTLNFFENQHIKMTLIFTITGISIITIIFLICCVLKNSKQIKYYYIAISNQSMNLWDKSISIGGNSWGGRIFIKINGNPIQTIEYGGALIEVSQWVRPGNNVLSFDGNITNNFYYKIIEMTNAVNIKKVYAADVIKPEDINDYKKISN